MLQIQSFLLILLLLCQIKQSCQLYGRLPGERYLEFLKTLNESQKVVVRSIIFDPHLTKDQARKEIDDWVHEQSPLTMESYDRAQMNYDIIYRRNERTLNKREQEVYSDNAKLLDVKIREIYNNGSLTERQACDTAANVIKIADPPALAETGLEALDCDEIFAGIFD